MFSARPKMASKVLNDFEEVNWLQKKSRNYFKGKATAAILLIWKLIHIYELHV